MRKRFQSTHPYGVRLRLGQGAFTQRCGFQSTHPYGVRPPGQVVRRGMAAVRSFNPRTPTGCDFTMDERASDPLCFNPRTPTGCDHVGTQSAAAQLGFNPRTPTGCDLRFFGVSTKGSFVSIHAPLRGATNRKTASRMRPAARFNPRTPTGCDLILIRPCAAPFSFNPRTPTGCDRGQPQGNAGGFRFQSTHPYGVRL